MANNDIVGILEKEGEAVVPDLTDFYFIVVIMPLLNINIYQRVFYLK